MGLTVYRSLLETVALYPKKKHLKKIIEHVIKYEGSECDSAVLDLIVQIGVQERMPVLLGTNVKYFLQNGFNLSVNSFKNFVLFLDRCKGYEEDAKRFVTLTTDTKSIQIDYRLLRPLFLRTIHNKTGSDVLQLFE